MIVCLMSNLTVTIATTAKYGKLKRLYSVKLSIMKVMQLDSSAYMIILRRTPKLYNVRFHTFLVK
jgi:hypothetical protein